MNDKVKNGLLITGLVIAMGLTLWAIKAGIDRYREDLEDEGDNNTPTSPSSGTASSTSAPKPIFDGSKVLRPGAASSLELKESKKIFNKIIESARAMGTFSPPSGIYDPIKALEMESRRKAIADLGLLDTDSKYGDATKKVALKILGVADFTYNGTKQKAKDFASVYKRSTPTFKY